MVNQISALFYKTIEKHCNFLVTEYCFLGPFTNIYSKNEIFSYQVWYLGKNIGIEFYLEERDEDINCMISQLTNGKRPEMWTDDYKYNQRVFLGIWCDWKRIKREPYQKLSKLCFEEKIPILIDKQLSILKEFGHEILEDKAGILNNIPSFVPPKN
jgi:hypothetical protein